VGPRALAVADEAGPGGYELYRLLSSMSVACDVIAPSLIPVRAGDRVKSDRREAKKLVRLYRAGELSYVAPPAPMHEGLRDLGRCRDDLRCARTAARHRVVKTLLRYGHIYREGKAWTLRHRAWVESQRLADPLAHAALEHMLTHLAGLDAQLAALDHQLEQIATGEPWADPRGGYSSRQPGITATDPANRPVSPAFKSTSHPRSAPAPGRPRCACTTATARLPNTASTRPSQTSPSPAS
jgi:transposase